MTIFKTWSLSLRVGAVIALVGLLGLTWGLAHYLRSRSAKRAKSQGSISNNKPMPNPGGEAASLSLKGSIDLNNEFFHVQGSNGQSCATCHIPEEGWSITTATLQRLFEKSEGKDPVFNLLDANNPNMDVSTKEARRAAFSMLLTHGVFRRGGVPRPDSEWELIAAEDPHGLATTSRLVQWRRSMPTTNFPIGSLTVNWDAGSNIGKGQRAALVSQTNRLVTVALQGPPPTPQVVDNIVEFESSLFTAQITVPGAGRLDSNGARGGPEALSKMSKLEGDFDLFNGWVNDANPSRAQIARGQQVFNSINPSHKSCVVCHTTVNNGTNLNNGMFDISTASEEVRPPGFPLYTFRNKTTGTIVKLTDAGWGNITGRWDDLGRFKTPTLRGLSARAPYFHNGIAATLEDVVKHYEKNFGFIFTDQERADLVAFLKAL